MVFFPLSFRHFTVRIYYLALPVKHRFPETSLVNLSVFPSEFTRPIYLILFEITFQNSILGLNCTLALSFTVFELAMVLNSTFGLDFTIFVMHQTSAEFAHVLATAVIPSVSAGTLLKTRLKPSQVLSVLFIDSLDGISLRRSIFPYALNRIYVLMSKDPLAVHWRVLHFSLIVTTVREYNQGLVIIGLTVLKLPFVVSAVLKNCNSKCFGQLFIVEIALVVGSLWGYVKEGFSLYIDFFVWMQFWVSLKNYWDRSTSSPHFDSVQVGLLDKRMNWVACSLQAWGSLFSNLQYSIDELLRLICKCFPLSF